MATIQRVGGTYRVSFQGRLIGVTMTRELALELVKAVRS